MRSEGLIDSYRPSAADLFWVNTSNDKTRSPGFINNLRFRSVARNPTSDSAVKFSGCSAALLLVVGAFSLVLTTYVNSSAGHLLEQITKGGSRIAYACVRSAVAALAIYLAVRPARPLALPDARTPWSRVLRISGIWLAAWLVGSFAYASLQGHWNAYASGTTLLIGFLVLGPFGEELLFRGAIFELVERSFPGRVLVPVLLSAVLFSAHHLQLYAFKVTPFVITQIGFTLPMGIVFAQVRSLTGSIWPSFLLHVLTNLPHAFGSASNIGA